MSINVAARERDEIAKNRIQKVFKKVSVNLLKAQGFELKTGPD